jgi:hypothetical protein
MPSLKETSKARGLRIESANTPPEPEQEFMTWIMVALILAMSAFSFYMLWAKANRGF